VEWDTKMFNKTSLLSVSILRVVVIVSAVALSCTTPKAVLWSQSRMDPKLDASMTAYIVSTEEVAAAAASKSQVGQVGEPWAVHAMQGEFYRRAVGELAAQLRDQGLTLVDSPADADLVFEFYLEETSFARPATAITAGDARHGLLRFGTPIVADVILDRMKLKRTLSMAVWNLDNWINPIERLDIWFQNPGSGRFMPDSLLPGWFAVLEPPGESLDFVSRVDTYISLLLSAYGRTVTEEHSIRPGPPRNK